MQTKIILALTAAVLVIATLAAVAAVQYAGAQNLTQTQTPQPYNGYYAPAPLNVNGTYYYPCYPYTAAPQPQVPPQAAYAAPYGRMGMCGRFW